ncbi:ThiF family adenylyltransferase [Glaciibacter superstes]|uniref:ThiF family adenylyltransferase n=1 Tax=Glaciibacter superstes TaxID=501023 RepID=UPI0003B41025|nr:ThiF family adenylyltransferase [Glaciibacter superstes]
MESTRPGLIGEHGAIVGPGAIVGAGLPLTPDRLTRYSRQLFLPGFGVDAQRRLANARVLVVGAGGLGSASIPYLASAGVGTIGIIDTDVVELSNLHRQIAHGVDDLGRSKVDSIADSIAAIDPEIEVVAHRVRLEPGNAADLLAGYDLVMDGSDNFQTRYLTNDAAAEAGMPLVWGAILRFAGQVGVAWAGVGPTYRDLFPAEPDPDDVLSCSVGGVLPTVCAVIGSIMATEAIKLITGVGEPLLGRVTTYDALSGRFRELEYQEIPDEARTVAEGATHAPRSASRGRPQPGAVTPVELADRFAAGGPMQLIDVREPFEAEIASIPGAELIPLASLDGSLERISRDVPVVVFCHHGSRANRAMAVLERNGYRNAELLEGGIDAYARLVAPALARY